MSLLACLLVVLVTMVEPGRAMCLPVSNATFAYPPISASGYKATLVFGGLTTPRDIQFDDNGALLVIERGVGVSAFVEHNDKSCIGWDRTLILSNTALTNGISVEVRATGYHTGDISQFTRAGLGTLRVLNDASAAIHLRLNEAYSFISIHTYCGSAPFRWR